MTAASAWKALHDNTGKVVKNAAWLLWQWMLDGATWLGEWMVNLWTLAADTAVNTIDIGGDVLAWTTDFVTNAATWGQGTHLNESDGWADKLNDKSDKFTDSVNKTMSENSKGIRDLYRKELGGGLANSDLWKFSSDTVNFAWTLLSPIPWAWAITKWVQATKWSANTIKAAKALDKASEWNRQVRIALKGITNPDDIAKVSDQVYELIKNGQKVTPEMITNIAKGISKTDNIVPVLTKEADSLLNKMVWWSKDKIIAAWDKHPYVKKLIYSLPKNHPVKTALLWSFIKNTSDLAEWVSEETQTSNLTAEEEKEIKNVSSQLQLNAQDSTNDITSKQVHIPKGNFDKAPDSLGDRYKEYDKDPSIVDTLNKLGINSAMEARKAVYENITGKPYRWSAEQNIFLKWRIKDMNAEEIQELMKKNITA